ncbi:DNA polymerase II subunit B3-1 [Quercus suber]|uniref:Nuclear transcription factor y subunit c-4 n=1 Tax=Quercus suber TaxID=58331 RepID=A0AAW0LM88_QUESU|nr:uncharacterized protein LOC112031090 isoform X1 [Quercus suber]POF01540.1 nuclear transcription factor y subunit c-4 [Quercus suber]
MASSKKSTTEEQKSKETKPKNTPKKKNKTTSTTKGNPEKNNNNNNKKVSNGTVSDSSSDVIIIPSSSIESGQDEKQKPDKSSGANKRTADADTKSKKHKQKKQKRQEEDVNDVVDKEEAKTHRFPMNRIKTILRSQDSDLRITHEALFLVNKATEKFLEEFTKDAHACCVQDHKKSLAYKHLSSVVCKTRSFDFLSDFVPEKLKAKDALAERKIAETENEAA